MSPRTIAVLTSGRQDWTIVRSTCLELRARPGLSLRLLVGGMHLSARHGRSVDLVRADGFIPDAELAWLDDMVDTPADTPADAQAAAALALVGRELRERQPDALLLAGDRLETAAAAVAATVTRVPIVHLHGGEQTGGAFDDALRHAITKLSHLHLVSHEEHARRVAALGEDPATIHVVGAPGLDAAFRPDLAGRAELEAALGIALHPPVIVVTVHPATLEPDPSAVVDPVVRAMDRVRATYVITLPNADPGNAPIRDALLAAASAPGRAAVAALGERRYWGLLRLADAMLGNSSSGIVEAPALDLPAVDVGERQRGRRREANVLSVPAEAEAVAGALRQALEPGTRAAIAARHPVLADGRAGQRIADIIAAWDPLHPPRKAPIPIKP